MSFDRTTYAREYARKQRRKKIEAKNMHTLRCNAMLCRGVPCRAPLRNRLVDGQTTPFCPRCDKKARGICIDCELPVVGTVGKALRCGLHKKLANIANLDRYKQHNAAKLRRKERKRMADPAVHADRLEYKRLYRQSQPRKVAQYKRAYYDRNKTKVLSYMQRYRAKHADKRREMERLRQRGELPPRSCLTCETILTGRAKRCETCKQQSRTQAREAIAVRLVAI